MFGTRATFLVDLTFAVVLASPVAVGFAIRALRARGHRFHRNAQLAILTVCLAAVFALEGSIRAAGGSGSLVAGSPYAGTSTLRTTALLHITGALLTYAVWIWLVVVSWVRYFRKLPGSFSRRHRRAGWFVFIGLVYTAVSASVMYWLGFVAG